MLTIKISQNQQPKPKPSEPLGFGKYYTDHMFLMDYENGQWHNARIVPYAPLTLDPATMVLHYAQETFEGLKAYRRPDGQIQLFRPAENAKRMQTSNQRLAMPVVEVEDFVQACCALVKQDQDWVPHQPGQSLYLRPFMFASEQAVGVHSASRYVFAIIASPVAAYYEQGINPVPIYVEDEYVRATPGGTGFAKCGGNYAASLLAQKKANELGYAQVLWLDGVHHRYVEEVGSMNAFFVLDGKLVTAPLQGTVLPGITRQSIIQLAQEMKVEVEERALDIDELMKAAQSGRLSEAFGSGTAAVISPMGKLYYQGQEVVINQNQTGPLTKQFYERLTGIQWGLLEDVHGWCYPV